MDLLLNLLPVPKLTPEQSRALQELPDRLHRMQYTESHVMQVLGIRDIPGRRYPHMPFYERQMRSQGKLGDCVGFFLMQQRLTPQELGELVGEGAAEALKQLNWLHETDGKFRSRVDLYPCLGTYIFTDCRFGEVSWQQQVYSLGWDSYGLARVNPRHSMEQTLDICTGSGVHTVLAARHAKKSFGVDINRRALQFSEINALVNGLDDRCRFLHSDVYAAVEKETFDLVTLNPPFVPTPDGIIELFRTGGATGEGVTERVVKGLDKHLTSRGMFSMFTEAPVLKDSFPLERLSEWLSGQKLHAPGWGLAALHLNQFPVETYIANHLLGWVHGKHEDEYERWLKTYDEVGIVSMWSGQYIAQRLDKGSHWRKERWIAPPWYDYAPMLEHWLKALDTWSGEIPAEWVPRLHPLVRSRYHGLEGALLEFKDPCWAPQRMFLPPRLAEVVQRLEDELTVSVLATALECSLEDLHLRLRELGEELVLTSWADPAPPLGILLNV